MGAKKLTPLKMGKKKKKKKKVYSRNPIDGTEGECRKKQGLCSVKPQGNFIVRPWYADDQLIIVGQVVYMKDELCNFFEHGMIWGLSKNTRLCKLCSRHELQKVVAMTREVHRNMY